MTHSRHAVTGYFGGDFQDSLLESWAAGLRTQLEAPAVTLGLVHLSPRYFPRAREILEILRVRAQVPLLVGCSSPGLVVDQREVERGGGLVLQLLHLPGAVARAFSFTQSEVESHGPENWRRLAGPDPAGLIVFADPHQMDAEAWITAWNRAWPGTPMVGGIASGDYGRPGAQLYLQGKVLEEGGVAVALSGEVSMECVVSQGCTPVGDTWTVTRAEGPVIHEIANRPAYEVMVETFEALSHEEKQRSRGHLFVGIVTNEYLEDFRRGDFLVRNLIGADPDRGAIVVGTLVRPGQTLQFHIRDAEAASEDLEHLLAAAAARLAGRRIHAGLLYLCNGRGAGLFHQPSHDARRVQQHFPGLPVAGFFCNGEVGPVGPRSHLHGYTACLGLIGAAPRPAAATQPT